jgi:hypothetical protein
MQYLNHRMCSAACSREAACALFYITFFLMLRENSSICVKACCTARSTADTVSCKLLVLCHTPERCRENSSICNQALLCCGSAAKTLSCNCSCKQESPDDLKKAAQLVAAAAVSASEAQAAAARCQQQVLELRGRQGQAERRLDTLWQLQV